MDVVFTFFKVIFMSVFGLSLVLYDKHVDTDRWGEVPVWVIAAAQSPLIILYSLFG